MWNKCSHVPFDATWVLGSRIGECGVVFAGTKNPLPRIGIGEERHFAYDQYRFVGW